MWLSVHYARSFAIVQAQIGLKLVSVIRNSRVSAVERFEVYGDMVGTFRNVHYNTSVQECPLNGVPL